MQLSPETLQLLAWFGDSEAEKALHKWARHLNITYVLRGEYLSIGDDGLI